MITSTQSKQTLWLLVLILVLAFGLRVIALETRSLWYDEAFSVLFVRSGLDAMLDATINGGLGAEIHPMLYYVTLGGWMQIFGESASAVRLWSGIAAVLTVGVAYLVGRDLFRDPRTGLAAALLTAISPFHVQYSQETRMYSLMALLLLAATWCFVRGWRSGAWSWWIGFGLLAALAMHTQQLAAMYLVTLGLIPLVARKRDQFIRVLVGAIIAFALYLPWIIVSFSSQFDQLRTYWVERPNLARPLLTLRSFLSFNGDFPPPASMLAFLGALFVTLFLAIQAVIFLRSRRRRDRRPLLFALWLAFVPMALLWLVSQVQPVYIERALLPSALAFYLALAWLFTRSGTPRPVLAVLGVIVLALSGVGLYYHYTWNTFPNSPFQEAAEYVGAEWQAGDVVVHQNKLTALPMRYYDAGLEQRYLRDLPGAGSDTLALATQRTLDFYADECIQTASGGANRLWLVMFVDAPRQYEAAGVTEIRDMLAWLETHYTPAGVQTFNDLDVYLFEDGDGEVSECE